jgi:hypothetical protein
MTRSRRAELIGSHRRTWTAGLAVFAFSAVAVVASACGGGGSGAGGSSANAVAHLGTTTTTSGAGAAAGAGASAGGGPNAEKIGADLTRFSSCMQAHGVPNFPNPQFTGNGVNLRITPNIANEPQFKKAQQTCQKYLPKSPAAQHFTTAQQADYVKAAQCMRAHGINGFPDPDFSGGGVRFPLPQGENINPNSPQFESARHICQNLIPNGLPYSSTDENP